MKLFVKYSRVNIIASILALLLGSLGYYLVVRAVLIHQLDDALKIEEAEILSFAKTRDRLPEPANYRDQQITYTPATEPVKRRFCNKSWYSSHHQEMRPFRELKFSVTAAGQLYTVSVAQSEVETEDLLEMIMLITAGMILLMLGTLFLASRLLLRRIWQPFYDLLDGMRKFNLSSKTRVAVAATSSIDEFRELNSAVEQMTAKILRDYEVLKDFADNASHEMQTPLAIINSKLDLMIQDQALSANHLGQLQAMYDAVGRLRRLNQSLLLLTKIENNQFGQTEEIALQELVQSKLIQFEDLIRAKDLLVKAELEPVNLRINSYLADILLNNLLSNAIRHNREGGTLVIELKRDSLQIGNTGPALGFDEGAIFDRFTKGAHSDGTGLGLAIVKQICDNTHINLVYSYLDGMHWMRLTW